MKVSNEETSLSQLLIFIYWDVQNVHTDEKSAKLLLEYAANLGDLYCKKAYAHWRKEAEKFEKYLYRVGFECINIPSSEKNAVDKKLEENCKSDILKNPGERLVILVSKDKDFSDLVRHLKAQGIKVIVFAEAQPSKQLQKLTEYHLLEELPQLIKAQTKTQPVSGHCQMLYNEAIDCLIEAINIASNEGRDTVLAYIGKLMRRNPRFPICQKKFPVIYQSDGRSFSKLSKLIDAAVQDGVITVDNGHLFLS